MTNQFRFALSHSRLNDYNTCPLKFKLKYIDKASNFKEDGNKSPHLIRGTNVHAALENHIIARNSGGELKESTLKEVQDTMPLMDRIFEIYPQVLPEAQICVNSDWNRVDWFAPNAYMRAIFDVIGIASDKILIGDWKTGKYTDYTPPSGYGQLELSAAIALSMWPERQVVDVAYYYVDHRKSITKSYSQDRRIELVDHFNEEHLKVNSDTRFDPKVNQFCKWCEATKAQCPYSRKL